MLGFEWTYDKSGHATPNGRTEACETLTLKWREEVLLLLGQHGYRRNLVCRLSQAGVDIRSPNSPRPYVTVSGPDASRERAKWYIEQLLAQVRCRIDGSPTELTNTIDMAVIRKRTDVTVATLPRNSLGFVCGKKRQNMQSIEETFDVLVFFVTVVGYDPSRLVEEQLGHTLDGLPRPPVDSPLEHTNALIVGRTRNRIAALLTIMGATAAIMPDYYVVDGYGKNRFSDAPGMAVDEYCIAEGSPSIHSTYLHRVARLMITCMGNGLYFIAGTPDERRRGKEYLDITVAFSRATLHSRPERYAAFKEYLHESGIHMHNRNDMERLEVPEPPERPRDIALECGTFVFVFDPPTPSAPYQVVIVSTQRDNRDRARSIVLSAAGQLPGRRTPNGASAGGITPSHSHYSSSHSRYPRSFSDAVSNTYLTIDSPSAASSKPVLPKTTPHTESETDNDHTHTTPTQSFGSSFEESGRSSGCGGGGPVSGRTTNGVGSIGYDDNIGFPTEESEESERDDDDNGGEEGRSVCDDIECQQQYCQEGAAAEGGGGEAQMPNGTGGSQHNGCFPSLLSSTSVSPSPSPQHAALDACGRLGALDTAVRDLAAYADDLEGEVRDVEDRNAYLTHRNTQLEQKSPERYCEEHLMQLTSIEAIDDFIAGCKEALNTIVGDQGRLVNMVNQAYQHVHAGQQGGSSGSSHGAKGVACNK
mmetsp:Transcript_38349/g.109573  ORF Transcript_38349/g.109573 Transcript_38349/m.109573 type:complete len:702 (+) Transcript_38349:298-2403(+)